MLGRWDGNLVEDAEYIIYTHNIDKSIKSLYNSISVSTKNVNQNYYKTKHSETTIILRRRNLDFSHSFVVLYKSQINRKTQQTYVDTNAKLKVSLAKRSTETEQRTNSKVPLLEDQIKKEGVYTCLSNNHRTNVCMYLLHETLSHACPINEQLTGLRVRVVEPSKLGGRVICQHAAHPRFSTTKPIIAFAENLLTSLRWSLYSTDNNYISIIFTAVDHVEQGSPLTGTPVPLTNNHKMNKRPWTKAEKKKSFPLDRRLPKMIEVEMEINI
ncbi:hypothetical protein V1477_011061 [Vespula maculifrons]|uniref:Uncharacterized protein n=1 Tax=Vespula maculifrons TaxID=7453 RepID=A0ABD2C3R1_VESMC